MAVISNVSKVASTILGNADVKKTIPISSNQHKLPVSNIDKPQGLLGWTAKALASLSLLIPLGASNTEAANNPQREKAIANLAQESWKPLSEALGDEKKYKELNNSTMLWNNLQAVFHVSDDTMIEAVESIRAEVLEKGKSNPNIPARLVHGALYTTGVTANKLNLEIIINQKKIDTLNNDLKTLQKQTEGLNQIKIAIPKELTSRIQELEGQVSQLKKDNASYTARRDKMVNTVIPYLGKIIVDTKDSDGVRERHLVLPSRIALLGKRYPEVAVYKSKDFHLTAADALGKMAEANSLEKSLNELFTSGNDTERRNNFFEIYLSTPQNRLPKGLIEKSRQWVFGDTQLKAHEKGKTKGIGIAPPLMPPASKDGPAPATALPTIPNPGLPPGRRAGSLDALKEIDARLASPLLPYPFSKEEGELEFLAKNILLLAQNNDEFALPAAAQWFAIKHYSEDGQGKTSTPNNFIVLQALAKQAQKDKTAFEILRRVCASNPQMFMDALVAGEVFLDNSPDTRAGFDLIKAFNTNSTLAKDLMTKMADKNAKLIWPEPSRDEDVKTANDLRALGRNYALMTMSLLDDSRSFTPYLRGILQNPFSTEMDRFRAAVGVALAKDKESIEPLFAMSANETLPLRLRGLALDAVLYINAPDLVPDSIRKKAQDQSPFSPGKLSSFFPEVRYARGQERLKINFADEMSTKNPFQRRIAADYDIWLKSQEAISKREVSQGSPPATVTDEEKLQMLHSLYRREFGGNTGIIAAKAKDANFSTKYLTPLVNYLQRNKDAKKNIDLSFALSSMDILARANHEPAASVIADIATYPEAYLQNKQGENKQLDFFGLLFDSIYQSVLKRVAIEDLGGVVPLNNANDSNAQILHTVLGKESSGFYRWGAWSGLDALADRYENYRKNPHTLGSDNLKIIAAQKAHGSQVIGHMQHHSKGLETSTQPRLASLYNEFANAKLADRFIVRKELLTLVNEAYKKDQKAPLIRNVMHALISNGCKLDNISKLGFDATTTSQLEKLYRSIDRQEFWLGDASKQTYTGKGVEAAVLDVGYAYNKTAPVNFYPGLEKNIIYPENLIRWNDLTNYLDLHPTAVASTTHKVAPDAKMWSYSVAASTPEVPFRPSDTQSAEFRALEDMAQNMLEDKANISAVNYSWGYMAFILNNEKLRTEWVDELGAFMETLSRMNVMHTVAAGNEHGLFPGLARYRGSELNVPGLRFDNKGKVIQPDNVLHAAAMDKYADRLAEFTSKQDLLRKLEAIRLLAFQGVHVIAPWVDNGQWELSPVNGTSFAAPHNMAMLAWGIEARKKAGLAPLTARQWQHVFSKSIGRFKDQLEQPYFDVTIYLQEVLRPQIAARPPVAPQPQLTGKK